MLAYSFPKRNTSSLGPKRHHFLEMKTFLLIDVERMPVSQIHCQPVAVMVVVVVVVAAASWPKQQVLIGL